VKTRLIEAGETLLGVAWWGATKAWAVAFTALMLITPLILANMAAEVLDALSATVAIGVGVVGAYALGLPPWDAEERFGLLLVIGGSTASVVVWELMRATADAGSLLVALALTLLGWPIRRAFASAPAA
jgi:hypothetical protein